MPPFFTDFLSISFLTSHQHNQDLQPKLEYCILISVSVWVSFAAMMQKRPNVPVEALNPVMSNATQRTREVLDVTQKLVVTLISHPRLAGWLGQVLAKKEEKEVTEGVPEIESEIEKIAPTIIPKVEDIITSDKKGSTTPNIAPAEE